MKKQNVVHAYLVLLRFTDHCGFYCLFVCFLNKLKVCDNPVLRNSIGANFPKTICFTTCFCVTFW